MGQLSVQSFGAVGNGVSADTGSIQRAIDACHTAGGGEVFFPAGTYLVGTIRLRSGVALRLGAGSVLAASTDPLAYSSDVAPLDYCDEILRRGMFSEYGLIYAENATSIEIGGPGTIDGRWTPPGDARTSRPMLVRIVNCTDVRINDVNLERPPSFTCYFERCAGIRIRGVTIRSRETPNGDGLDFNGCEDVMISGCRLDCGDDAISLKPLQRGSPSRRFVISDCTISSAWAAIRLGPESFGGMRDIVVSNCVLHDCRDGLKIQNCEGSTMENMAFSNIVMSDVNRPLFFTLNRYRFSRHSDPRRLTCGVLRNIMCSNIRATSRRPCSDHPHEMPCNAIVGLPDHSIEGVSMVGVDITMPGGMPGGEIRTDAVPELDDTTELWPEALHFRGPLPCSALYLRHVRGFSLHSARIAVSDPDNRPLIGGDDVRDASASGLDVRSLSADGSTWEFGDGSELSTL